MPLMLINNWKYIAIAFLVVALGLTIIVKNKEISSLTIERNQYKSALEFQNEQIIKNKTEYDDNLAKANSKKEKIVIRYKVIYETIDNFGKDKNETCDDSLRFLNDFSY